MGRCPAVIAVGRGRVGTLSDRDHGEAARSWKPDHPTKAVFQKCLSVSDEDEVAVGLVLKLLGENEQLSRRFGRGGRVVEQGTEPGDEQPHL